METVELRDELKIIRERNHKLANDVVSMQAVIMQIKDDIIEIKGLLRGDFVRVTEFTPIKNIVYGMVGLILMAVLGALVALVVK